MSLDPAWSRWQAQLLQALADGVPSTRVRSAAVEHAPDPAVAAWVEGWDADLVELAGVLVRTWAVRDA